MGIFGNLYNHSISASHFFGLDAIGGLPGTFRKSWTRISDACLGIVPGYLTLGSSKLDSDIE